MSKNKNLKILIAAAAVLALLAAGPAALAQAPGYEAVYAQDNPVPAIVQAVRPAVVQVCAYQGQWTQEAGTVYRLLAAGSGVYVDERGYIITNNHIVENCDKVEVTLLEGDTLPARILGTDSGTDLAVLQVEGEIDAQPVPMGDSDQLQIGELAIAIGNPGDSSGTVLVGSVTVGVISALDREDVSAGNFTRSVKVIQTDAAINTGNSGGALLNYRGQLIGIPTLKLMYDMTTVYEGLGFAVPINTVKPVFEQLVEKGYVSRPRLGVTVVTLEGPEQPLRNYPPMGAQVVEVEAGGPAALAGVQPGDIILSLDGTRIETTNQLVALLDGCQFGQQIALEVCRYFDPATSQPLDQWQILTLSLTLNPED